MRRVVAFVVLGFSLAPAQAPDPRERARAWSLWREINKHAWDAREVVPVWQVWCGPDEGLIYRNAAALDDTRCTKEFIYAAGLNLRKSSQLPEEAGDIWSRAVSVHMNPELLERLLDYRGEAQDQPEAWLIQSPLTEPYAQNATQSHLLYPFGKEAPPVYSFARTVKNRVPIAVKAAWQVFDPSEVCRDPSSAKVPYYDPAHAPAGYAPYPPSAWPDARFVDLSSARLPCRGYQPPAGAIPLSRFYHFRVRVQAGALKPGGIAVLTGLHVATRETEDWIWSTFYWHPEPDKGFGADRPADVPAPWNQYVMQTTKKQGEIVFNPYLEAGMKNGRISNCMSCHRMAALGRRMAPAEHCVAIIPDNAPSFRRDKSVLTDYLWSLTKGAKPWSCSDF